MGDDAHQPSQAAQDTPRTAELRQFVEELAGRLAAIEEERGRRRRMAEILDSAGGPQPPLVPARKPKRDRHGMHIVRGMVLPLGVAVHWLLRARWHRALAYTAALTTVAATGNALAPDMLSPAPAQGSVHVYHAAAHHRRPDVDQVTVPVPGRRKRRRLEHDETASPRPRVTTSAPPSPSPAPSPSAAPDPDPVPSVTLPPLPLPTPTCTWLTGHHCHDDDVGDAVRVLGALGGLTG